MAPHPGGLEPSVSAPVPCQSLSPDLLPTLPPWRPRGSLPSLETPLHSQASLFYFGKKYPSRPLGFQACLGWAPSGPSVTLRLLCLVCTVSAAPLSHPTDTDFLKQPSSVLSCPPGWSKGMPRASTLVTWDLASLVEPEGSEESCLGVVAERSG